MKTKTLENKEVELKNEVATITEQARELVITDQVSFDIVGDYLIKLATLKKEVITYFKPLKKATHEAHKAVTQKEKDELAPIDTADRMGRALRGDYKRKEDARIQKEQDRLDKLAKDKADRETAKLLKKAEKEEDSEKKEELEQKAQDVYVPPNIAAGTMAQTTKHEGGGSTTFIKDIDVDITDEMELLKEIVAGNAPITLIKFNDPKKWVKAAGIKNGQIKGIRISETQRESIRAR